MKKFLVLFTLFIALGIAGCGEVANDIKNGDITSPVKIQLDSLIGEYSIVDMNIDNQSIPQTDAVVKINTKDYTNVICSIYASDGVAASTEILYSDNVEVFLNNYISNSGSNVILTIDLGTAKAEFTLQKKSSYTANQGIGVQGEIFGLTVNDGKIVPQTVSEVTGTLNHMTNKTASIAIYHAAELAANLYHLEEPAMENTGSTAAVVDPEFSEITQTSIDANTTQFTAKTITGQLADVYYLVEAKSDDGLLTYSLLKTDVTPVTQAP